METVEGEQAARQFVAKVEIEQTRSGFRLRQYRIIDPVAKDSPPYFPIKQLIGG